VIGLVARDDGFRSWWAAAPATFYDHLAKRSGPSLLSAWAQRDIELKSEIERVFEENLSVYGVRKV
jgi:hypothetical protein